MFSHELSMFLWSLGEDRNDFTVMVEAGQIYMKLSRVPRMCHDVPLYLRAYARQPARGPQEGE